MKYQYLKAVILDWAGTAVDHGSLAPVAALQRVFAENGLAITAAEARRDMGVLKKDQIRFILSGDRVSREWSDLHGHAPSEKDVVNLFTEFLPKQAEIGKPPDFASARQRAIPASFSTSSRQQPRRVDTLRK
jgi:phosphonoacetaldehyde hydrolase